jgi:hypothetical protein
MSAADVVCSSLGLNGLINKSAFELLILIQGRIQDFEIGGAWSENIDLIG